MILHLGKRFESKKKLMREINWETGVSLFSVSGLYLMWSLLVDIFGKISIFSRQGKHVWLKMINCLAVGYRVSEGGVMRKDVVLAVVGCILVSLVIFFEWGVAESLPLTEQMISIQDGRSGLKVEVPELVLQGGENKVAQYTSADDNSEGPAPDPRSILVFGTGIVAWLMVMKMSKGM